MAMGPLPIARWPSQVTQTHSPTRCATAPDDAPRPKFESAFTEAGGRLPLQRLEPGRQLRHTLPTKSIGREAKGSRLVITPAVQAGCTGDCAGLIVGGHLQDAGNANKVSRRINSGEANGAIAQFALLISAPTLGGAIGVPFAAVILTSLDADSAGNVWHREECAGCGAGLAELASTVLACTGNRSGVQHDAAMIGAEREPTTPPTPLTAVGLGLPSPQHFSEPSFIAAHVA